MDTLHSFEPRYDAVPERVAAVAQPGDLVVTMGIGNVYLLCDEIRDACGRPHEGARCCPITRVFAAKQQGGGMMDKVKDAVS